MASLLFVHNNFPAQLGLIADAMAARGHDCRALSSVTGRELAGIPLVRWGGIRGSTPGIFAPAVRAEADFIRGSAAAQAALGLRESGFTPDVIVGHRAGAKRFSSARSFRRRGKSPTPSTTTARTWATSASIPSSRHPRSMRSSGCTRRTRPWRWSSERPTASSRRRLSRPVSCRSPSAAGAGSERPPDGRRASARSLETDHHFHQPAFRAAARLPCVHARSAARPGAGTGGGNPPYRLRAAGWVRAAAAERGDLEAALPGRGKGQNRSVADPFHRAAAAWRDARRPVALPGTRLLHLSLRALLVAPRGDGERVPGHRLRHGAGPRRDPVRRERAPFRLLRS